MVGKDYYRGYYENILRARDVAMYCRVSKSTVIKWISDGRLKAFRLPSGHYRIDKEDFRAFLERYAMPIKEELFGSESEKEGGEK